MAVPPVIDITSSQSATQSKLPASSHRLPTVSASQALLDLQNSASSFVPTGLPSVDALLSGAGASLNGGIERGKVTEVWGPSGAGKTAFALQVAMHAISKDRSAIWVDTTTPLSRTRMQSSISAADSSLDVSADTLKNFRHALVPTLSHLLALILHPPSGLFPDNASLLVVDGLNALVDLDYSRYQFTASTRTEQQKWHANRRYAILGSLVSAMNKLAVLNNVAVVVTTGCSTRMRAESGLGTALVPGIGGAEWDGGAWNRLVVFRDFGGRFVGVQKCQGKNLISRQEIGEAGRIVPFEVTNEGAVLECKGAKVADGTLPLQSKPKSSPTKPHKRGLDEIADSEDEDVDEYGWAEIDEDAMAAEGLIDDVSQAQVNTEAG